MAPGDSSACEPHPVLVQNTPREEKGRETEDTRRVEGREENVAVGKTALISTGKDIFKFGFGFLECPKLDLDCPSKAHIVKA